MINKIIIYTVLIIFISSIYIMPSLSALTLGEIQPDKITESSGQNNDKKVKSGTDKTREPVKKPVESKKAISSAKNKKEPINPRLVCLLSVIMPGGGHFYIDKDTKGIGFCLAAGIGYTATGFFAIKMMLSDPGSTAYKNYLLLAGFLFFVSLVIHFVGIIEAYSDAEEINREKLFGSNTDNPFITELIYE